MSRLRIACLAALALALASAAASAQTPDPEFARRARVAAQARALRSPADPAAPVVPDDSLNMDASLAPLPAPLSPTSIIQPYGTWKLVPPPTLFGASTVLDPVRERIIMAGGSNGYFQRNVWTLSLVPGSRWQLDSTASAQAPGLVAYAATAYDPVHARMILFGGLGHGAGSSAAASSEVWSLSLGSSLTWSRPVVEGTPPSPRWNCAEAYDSRRNRLLVYGGEDAFGPLADIWALDLGDTMRWSLLTPADSIPQARTEATAVYDPLADRFLVYGGVTEGDRPYDISLSQELWSLSLGDTVTWRKLDQNGNDQPYVAVDGSAAFDPLRRRMILLGGLNGSEAWVLDLNGPPSWQHLNVRPGFDREKFTILYDAPRDRALCVGGTTSAADESDVDVLSLADPGTWSLLGAHPKPAGRAFAVTMFDSRRMRMVLFGGSGRGAEHDTWTVPLRDLAAWTRLATSAHPARFIGRLVGAYDPIGDRCFLFGLVYGDDTHYFESPREQLWTLSLADTSASWQRLEVTGEAPPARTGSSMIYDPPRHRLVLFGGRSFLGWSSSNEVWALSLDGPPRWTQIHTFGPTPLPRENHTAVYDPVHDCMLILGGYLDRQDSFPFRSGPSQDTASSLWALQLDGLPEWKALEPEGSIPSLYGQTLVYDSVHSRMLLHGGRTDYGGQYSISTWGLNLEPELRWEYLITSGDPATGSIGGSAAYDPAGDRLVVFGGDGITGYKNDLWTLDFSPEGAARRPAWIVSASNEGGAVRLVWGCEGGAGTTATVYRRDQASGWLAIATVQADEHGEIHFVDMAPANRWTEIYRLGVTQNGVTTYSADTSLPLQLTRTPLLSRAYPNPARAESFQVDFQLPSAHPARLDLVDVRGRVVWSGTVSASGPGPESFRVTARPRSGVYWLHLTQDGQEATLKTVVLQ